MSDETVTTTDDVANPEEQAFSAWGAAVVSREHKQAIADRIAAKDGGRFQVGCDKIHLEQDASGWVAHIRLAAAGVVIDYRPEEQA